MPRAASARAVTSPEVYSLDDDGYNKEVGHLADVKPDLEEAARTGSMACPDAAIRLFE
jgi:ferredoxin